MKYFSKVPLVNYNGQSARNLLARAQLTPQTKQNTTVFYPYTVNPEDATDVLSYKYYDNSDYAWLIWMANEVVDPYYDMSLSDDNFKSFITKKYGSIQTAQARIKFWRNDWSDDETTLTPAEYNALPCFYDETNQILVNTKKYYDPTLDVFGSVYGYSRKPEDWVISTNRSAAFAATIVGTFIEGERVRKNTSNYGNVVQSGDNQMTVQHITGTFSNGDVLVGSESGATCTITSVPSIHINIPSEEQHYWSPVTYYQYEMEENDRKKEIVLIDNRYKQAVDEELTRVFRG